MPLVSLPVLKADNFNRYNVSITDPSCRKYWLETRHQNITNSSRLRLYIPAEVGQSDELWGNAVCGDNVAMGGQLDLRVGAGRRPLDEGVMARPLLRGNKRVLAGS